MPNAENLVRKQYLIHPDQIAKINLLAEQTSMSAAEMVRRAIDAYNPDVSDGLNDSDLLELVAERLKEAIADTQKTNDRVTEIMEELGVEGV